jgi:Spy/CpxP family protein refolding chaperone
MKIVLALPVVLSAGMLQAGAALAQSHQQPYAGQEKRAVKALSETELADLLAGRGMGLAKAAELNGYPGPMHVLEHAVALKLTDAQRQAVEAARARMAAAAKALGREIVATEAALDAAFAEKRIDADALKAATDAIAALMGRLRAVHLAAHLETAPLLTPAQLAQYAALRGYGRDAKPQHHQPRQN